MEIRRFRDEAKILEAELRDIIGQHVEKQTGRKVHSIELHNSNMGIGAVTIKFEFQEAGNDF